MGRDEALEALFGVLREGRGRGGGPLFLLGEAGLGKTSLLRQAAAAAADDYEIAEATGERMETTVPFGLLDRLMASHGAVAGLLGPNGATGSDAFVAAYRWAAASRERPLLVLADDLHWADPDSLGVLAFLARRAGRLPMVLVGAMRPWPPAAAEALAGIPGSSAVTLDPLDEPDSALLLERRLGRAPSRRAEEEAWRLSRGNPLLLEQAARLLDEEEEARVGGRRDPGPELILGRFAGFDERAIAALRAGSALGTRFRFEDACEVAGLPGEALAAPLLRGGLLEEAPDGRVAFVHPLFSQALYESMDGPSRRALHARAFELFAERGRESEAAEHAIRADLVGRPEAVRLLARVAGEARSGGAVTAAAEMYSAAVRLAGDRPDPELALQWAEALLAAVRVAEAAEAAGSLLAREDLEPAVRGGALRVLAHAHYLAGDAARGSAELDRAAEILRAEDPARAVHALVDIAVTAWMSEGPRAAMRPVLLARELSAALPRLAEEVGPTLGHLEQELEAGEGWRGALPYGRRLKDGEIELDPVQLNWPGSPAYGFAHCAFYGELYGEALEALAAARRELERRGAAAGITTVSVFIANHLNRTGRPEEGLLEADRAEEFADLTPLIHPFARMVRAESLAWLGRLEEAREIARAASAAQGPWVLDLWVAHVMASIELWLGRVEEASRHSLEAEAVADRVGLLEPTDQPWQVHAVPAHLAAGRIRDAARVAERLTEAASRSGRRWPAAMAAAARAALLEHEGDDSGAERELSRSVELLDGLGQDLRLAEVLLRLGGLLRRRGGAVAARAPLARALSLAEGRGAAHLASLASQELKVAGGRRRRDVTQRDRLTEAEARTALLAAEGLTNRQIAARLHVSENTVRTHMKRVLSKLDESSRHRLRPERIREMS